MLIQRLGSETQKNDKFTDELIEIIKNNPGSCSEVWLASDYGFPTLSAHARTAEILKKTAEKFRSAGIKVSLQISNTIGHGEYMSERDCSGLVYEGSPAEKMTGADGKTADYCFCPNGKHFRGYVRAFVKEYAKILPDCVWIDDDLRMSNHDPVSYGCFCPECMGLFNKRYRFSFTREELVFQINFGDMEIRSKYVEFLRDVLYDFTYMISEAVHEVSPKSAMGLQYVAHGGYTGFGFSNILDAMKDATGILPRTRPGGGAYDDYNPNVFFDKADHISWQNFMLPGYVEEKCPEIENLPDVKFGKSVAGTCFETTYYFASGATSMSYALLMNGYEPMEWHAEMLAAFSKHHPYWKKLADVSKTTVQAGIVAAYPKKKYLNKSKKEFDWCSELYHTGGVELAACAVPVAFSHDETSVYFLHHECAAAMEDDELKFLFDKPVICDGETLALLNARGFGFSADAEEIPIGKLYSEFSDHPVNSGFAGRRWSLAIYFRKGFKLTAPDGAAEPLGIYKSDAPGAEYVGEMSGAIIKTPVGARWAVFGDNLWNRVISSDKRRQILNTAEFLNPGRMTAVLDTPFKARILPREDAQGRLKSVTVTNCTVAKSGALQLMIRNPASERFLFYSMHNGEAELDFIRDGDWYVLELPPIDAWSSGTVFSE